MSNENIVCSHELVVRFDQLEDGSVNWLVQPDASIEDTSHASFDELAAAGAPLSAMGIRALWELLGENLVFLALEKANGYLWKELYRLQRQQRLPGPDVDGLVGGEAGEGVVVH